MVDILFEKVPYAKDTEAAKSRISSALQEEYAQIQRTGKTDLQAMGTVMSRYGTLSDAMDLVGIDHIPSDHSGTARGAFVRQV